MSKRATIKPCKKLTQTTRIDDNEATLKPKRNGSDETSQKKNVCTSVPNEAYVAGKHLGSSPKKIATRRLLRRPLDTLG